jgi:hypothetical protein
MGHAGGLTSVTPRETMVSPNRLRQRTGSRPGDRPGFEGDEMINSRQSTVALLAGALTLAVGGCGGKTKHASPTTAAANGTTSPGGEKSAGTVATTPSAPGKTPKPARPKSNKPSLADTPAKTLSFSGTGVKEIGKPDPLRIPTASTIHWTNDGAIFQIIPASPKVQSPVNSTGHSGTAALGKGAYYGFLINAVGHWTVKIVPGA